MTISFNEVPNNLRRPFVYIEFDSSRAVQGAGIQIYQNLVIGQRLSAGTVAASVPTKVTSADDASTFFGAGSMLHKMAQIYFANNVSQDTTFVACDDNAGGAKASGSFAFAGTATANGTIVAYIGGDRYTAGVTSGDTASTVAASLIAAINAATDEAVNVGQSSGTVNVEFKHKGVAGNELELSLNYFDDEFLPTGITCTVNAMASGTTNPDITAAIASLTDAQFNIIVMPYTDSSNLGILESELDNRWGPLTQNDGIAFTAKNASYATLASFGTGRNSKHISCLMSYKVPNAPWAVAAAYAAQVALSGQIDPARPFTTLVLKGIKSPVQANRLTNAQRNLLLFDGISTFSVDFGGLVRIERAITMYQKSPAGAVDVSYLDVNTVLTLSYLRWDFRNDFLLKFPRHKLADDGNKFGSGQAIMTPKLGKAFAIGKFRQWEEKGLVENIDQFKEDLIVERNSSDVNRLDFLLPPDLVNQLLVVGAQIQFLL